MPDDDSLAEIVHVTTRTISCDGEDGFDGHPKVYLHIEDTDIHCPYCSRHFVLKPGAQDTAH